MRKLFFFLFIPFLGSTQDVIDANRFLAIGMSKHVQSPQITLETIKFPVIEEYELRTRTQDLDFQSQQYTFRLKPSTPRKKKAQEAIFNHIRNSIDFDRQGDFCDLLFDTHIDWIHLYLIESEIRLLDQLGRILNDRGTLLEIREATLDFDFDESVKLEIARTKQRLDVERLKLEKEEILQEYGLLTSTFNFVDLISIAELESSLGELENVQLENDPELQFEKDLLTKELELEFSEQKQYIDFAQLRYEGPHSRDFGKRFSIGLGLRLPTSGNRKLRIQELKLDQRNLEREEFRNTIRQEDRRKRALISTRMDLTHFNILMDAFSRERAKLKIIADQVSSEEGFDPELLLEIEERHISNQMELLQKEEDIYLNYLRLIEIQNRFCQSEVINYLTNL